MPRQHPIPAVGRFARPLFNARHPLHVAIAAATLLAGAPAFAATATETAVLPAFKVKSQSETDGTAAQGYRVETIRQLGPLGEATLLDTPFSLNVISEDLIKNVQASKPDDVFRINPVIQLTTPQSRFFTGVTLRGFSQGSTKRIDGIPSTTSYVNVDIEDKERIEVITGLSGFLYGMGNVGGTLNYVLKRPTYQPRATVRAGVAEGENAIVHGDIGGAIDADQRFAYRLNAVYQDGDTELDHQSLNRKFVSGALDWNISDDVRLQFDASESRYRMAGTEPFWSAVGAALYPSAPDGDDYYGQPFTQTETEQQRVGARLEWRVSDSVSARAGIAQYDTALDLTAANNGFLVGPSGTYRVQASTWEYPDVEALGGFALADFRFSTGRIEHLLTAGWYGDRDERTNFRSSGGWATLTSAPVNLDQGPVYFDVTIPPASGPKYTTQRTRSDNWVVGDQITFNNEWSALIGVNRASIVDTSYEEDGAIVRPNYDDDAYTPSAALMYKPIPNVTLYVSYAESLEKGGVAPDFSSTNVAVVNAGKVMAPLESEQVEVGAKAQVDGVLLTAALFDIDKGLQYLDESNIARPVYVQDGRQVHKGVEFTASGRVLEGLTVLGGVTLLDAQVEKNASNPALEGKTPVNVAETMAKLYLEYDIAAVPGLTLTGGAYYTGEQQVNTLNTDEVPSYVTYDLGARYGMKAAHVPLTFRVGFTNVTGEDYWLNSTYLGRPRTLAASVEASF